jgi:cephalosporin-C deacetylase-like acetyl esterase
MQNQGMTESYIIKIAMEHFLRRRDRLNKIRTADDFIVRQNEIKSIVSSIIGPFPDRLPLKISSIQTLEREGHRVEVLTYQSLSNVTTTAHLYRPENDPVGAPGIVIIPGHCLEGKSQVDHQRLGQLFARRGIVTLIFDSIGQGERLEFYDSTLRSSWLGPKVQSEHTHLGNLLCLTGQHLANWMLWDAIRGLDVLVEHAHVDPSKLGVTGCGAGGALARLLCCLEPRLAAAAIVTDDVVPESLGGEDLELNLFGSIPQGLTLLDTLAVFAPKPLLLMACSHDRSSERFNAILQEVSRWYSLSNAPTLLSSAMSEVPYTCLKETYSKELRMKAVDYFVKVFQLHSEPVRELLTPPETVETLYCTETGQVSNSLKAMSVFEYHKKNSKHLPPSCPVPKNDEDAQSLQAEIRDRFLKSLHLPEPISQITSVIESRSNDWGYGVEKGRLVLNESLYIPYSFYTQIGSDGPRTAPTVVVLHDRGIAAVASHTPWMTGFAASGVHVLALDVIGTGETRLQSKSDDLDTYEAMLEGPESQWAVRALNTGLSLFGLRVFNVLCGLQYLRSRWNVQKDRISLVGVGRGALWSLYAAALDTTVSRVALLRGLASYKCLTERRRHNHHFSIYLPGCLQSFDLPQVAACVAPRPLTIINAVDSRKDRCDLHAIQLSYALAKSVYKVRGQPSAETEGLRLLTTDSGPETFSAVKAALDLSSNTLNDEL